MITFNCVHCGATITVSDSAKGQRGRCATCKKQITVPMAAGVEAMSEASLPADEDPLYSPPSPGESAAPPADAALPAAGATAVGMVPCPQCQGMIPPRALLCIHCGHTLQNDSNGPVNTVHASPAPTGSIGRAFVVCFIIAVLSGVLWAAIVRYTGFEFGILAWGIGFAVGCGVVFCTSDKTPAVGYMASVLALAGLLFGKVLIDQWAMPVILADDLVSDPDTFHSCLMQHMSVHRQFSPEVMAELDALDAQSELQGNEVSQDDEGETRTEAVVQHMEEQAQARARTLSESDKMAIAAEQSAQTMAMLPVWLRLLLAFSFFDLLWFPLSAYTAYRISVTRD